MKTILPVICAGFILFIPGHTNFATAIDQQISSSISPAYTLYFNTTLVPILQKNCSPCYFPGGKMYKTMPFDRCETIISHAAGMLKRFSAKKEKERVNGFMERSKLH